MPGSGFQTWCDTLRIVKWSGQKRDYSNGARDLKTRIVDQSLKNESRRSGHGMIQSRHTAEGRKPVCSQFTRHASASTDQSQKSGCWFLVPRIRLRNHFDEQASFIGYSSMSERTTNCIRAKSIRRIYYINRRMCVEIGQCRVLAHT